MFPCFVFAKEVYAEFNPYTSITDTIDPSRHITYLSLEHIFQYDDQTTVTNTKLVVSTDGRNAYSILLDENGNMIKGIHEEQGDFYFYDDNGYMLTKPTYIDEVLYEVHEDGRLYHHEWKDKQWYERGIAVHVNEDSLLFVQGESGFYCLQANTSQKMINQSITLQDGREVRFDENGNIVDKEIYENGKYYYPIAECDEQAKETYFLPVNGYMKTMQEENVRLINHRGYHVDVVENTMAAFMESKQKQYQYIETDVQMTKDNVPVLLHDGSFKRIAGIDQNIDTLTYEEAKQYSLGNQTLASLEQLLAYCKANVLMPYIELKTETIQTMEQIQIIYNIVEKYDMVGKVTWISFSPQLLQYMYQVDTVDTYGYVVGKKEDVNAVIQNALQMLSNGQNMFIDAQVEKQNEYLQICKDNNVPLQLWGINSEDVLHTINTYVTGITTDVLTH